MFCWVQLYFESRKLLFRLFPNFRGSYSEEFKMLFFLTVPVILYKYRFKELNISINILPSDEKCLMIIKLSISKWFGCMNFVTYIDWNAKFITFKISH